jgi:hypothetical protein
MNEGNERGGSMPPVIVYLDGKNDLKTGVSFGLLLLLSGWWILHGAPGLRAPSLAASVLAGIQLLLGLTGWLVMGAVGLFRRRYGRLRIELTETGCRVRSHALRPPKELRWEHLRALRFSGNRIELLVQEAEAPSLQIGLGSFQTTRAVKQVFRAFAARKGIEVIE